MGARTAQVAITYFAGLILLRIEKGKIEVLVINYEEPGKRAVVKFPGGVGRDGEVPLKVLLRETEEEVGEINLCDIREGYRSDPIEGQIKGVWTAHTKCFFLATKYRGRIRPHEVRDGNETLSAPFWIDTTTAARELFPSHQRAFSASMQKLVPELAVDKEMFDVLSDDPVLRAYL